MFPGKTCNTAIAAALVLLVTGCGGSSSGGPSLDAPASPPPPPPPATLSNGPATCAGGTAAEFSCAGVDLRSRVSLATMLGTAGNDVWGWADALTGREYALMGMTNGMAFVDVTDAENPLVLGILPTATVSSTWRDIKVYLDHAYVVADGAGAHGMQVFDLRRLRGVTVAQTFAEDTRYVDFQNAHNLAINEDTGFAYAVGTNTCSEGLHIVDITTPNNPVFAGCHEDFEVHDAQCVSYIGPDADYAGAEICANSAEDRVELVDVSNKSSTVSIADFTYPDLGFVHQGWLTEDQRFLLIGDEFDEADLGVPTRTHIFDVADLDAPVYISAYEGPTASIDHNLYILGNRVFEANYTAGLRVLEFGDLGNSELTEIAHFDTFPASNAVNFDGAWSVYPYLPSGNLLVSDDTNGLFILTLQ